MSMIKNAETKPEILVRKYFHSKGLRYRVNVKKLPGTPDIVLKKYKSVVFVNGCFWHMHDCKYFRLPKTRTDWWNNKLTSNKLRDENNTKLLNETGWNVYTVWTCELNKDYKARLDDIIKSIKKNMVPAIKKNQ